jgi:TIR domain
MKLFICHVSEDKPGFVEPLAHALRKDFEVWYDKFELKLGDSLLQKITEGLLSADFGIVVLAKLFSQRKNGPRMSSLDSSHSRRRPERSSFLFGRMSVKEM